MYFNYTNFLVLSLFFNRYLLFKLIYNYLNKLIKFFIILRIFLSLRSTSFLVSWIFLELNIIVFLLWGFTRNNKFVSVKYFFIQRIFSVRILAFFLNYNFIFFSLFCKFMILILLLGKLGLPPLFLWFVNIRVFRRLEILFILFSIQKFIPLYLLSRIFFLEKYLYIFTIFIRILGSSIQILLKKLLAYSSIINLLWIFLILNNFLFVILYIFLYIINLFLFFSFIKNSFISENIWDLNIRNIRFLKLIIIIIIILRLIGIPPFLGFHGKIIVFLSLPNHNWLLFFYFYILLFRFFLIYFYFRIIFNRIFRYKTHRILIKKDFLFRRYFFTILIFSLIIFIL